MLIGATRNGQEGVIGTTLEERQTIEETASGSGCEWWGYSVSVLIRRRERSTDSAETNWKRRRNEILSSLSKIQGTAVAPKPIEEKEQPLNKEEVRMNLQLMRGEVPQVYKDLLLRFKVADIFLKQGGSKMTRLTDVNNYLSLSDIKMSFLEKHVQQIVFLYAFEEKTDEE